MGGMFKTDMLSCDTEAMNELVYSRQTKKLAEIASFFLQAETSYFTVLQGPFLECDFAKYRLTHQVLLLKRLPCLRWSAADQA